MQSGVYDQPNYRTAGDSGLLVEYGEGIAPDINRKVRSVAIALAKNLPPGVREIVPSYRSILICYDPMTIGPVPLKSALSDLEDRLAEVEIPAPQLVELPVCYGGQFGPDLERVAGSNQLSPQEVVDLHSGVDYPIYMVGFTPGFPFLGGLPKALHTPRLATPRSRVPKGSVGIANAQTGVYPVACPGGWQLIGRTPLDLFTPHSPNPVAYAAGDRIRFTPISPDEFRRLSEKER